MDIAGLVQRREWLVASAIALIPLLVRVALYPVYPGADDAFIHLAIIEAIHNHGTWGVNPGENVNLSTSPLFTLCFLAVRVLTDQVMTVGLLLSSLAVIAYLLTGYSLARTLGYSVYTSLCALLFAASNVHLWRWGGTFMEVSFACLLVIATVRAFLVSRTAPFALGVLLGLLVLLRPELGLLLVACFLHDVINRTPLLLPKYARVVAGLLIPVAAYALFAWKLFGAVLPSTLAAKSGAGLLLWNPVVAKSIAVVVLSAFPGVWVLVVLSTFLPMQHGVMRRHTVLCLFPLLVCLFYYLKMPVLQSASRYLLPLLVCLPLAGLPFIDAVITATRAAITATRAANTVRWRRAMFAALILQLAFAGYMLATRIEPVCSRMWREYVVTMDEAANQVLRYATAQDVTLVDSDIGVVSWRLAGERRIADAGALASPELRGLSLAAKIRVSHARFVLQSLGRETPGFAGAVSTADEPLPPMVLLWEKPFRSHGVEHPDAIYYARLYEVTSTP